MKRRRAKLEVSTFPFLAVLLCAMGSLILVLLVMDRKAKRAALARAQERAVQLAEEARLAAEQRRAAREQKERERRAAWERRRAALHRHLIEEGQEVQQERKKVQEEFAEAAARLRAEQAGLEDLQRQVRAEQGQVLGAKQALADTRETARGAKQRSSAGRSALARMTAELVQLEQALKDLKAARERDTQTYSVVPYRGRHGENRRPVYIECAPKGLVLHPDRQEVEVGADLGKVRAAVEALIARQKAPAGQKPYLLVLVRPEGVENYYHLQKALKDLPVDFGYEFIDPDWLLDFPRDDDEPPAQPWMTVASATKVDATPPSPGTPRTRGVRSGGWGPGGEVVGQTREPGRSGVGGPDGPGTGRGNGGSPGAAGVGPGVGTPSSGGGSSGPAPGGIDAGGPTMGMTGTGLPGVVGAGSPSPGGGSGSPSSGSTDDGLPVPVAAGASLNGVGSLSPAPGSGNFSPGGLGVAGPATGMTRNEPPGAAGVGSLAPGGNGVSSSGGTGAPGPVGAPGGTWPGLGAGQGPAGGAGVPPSPGGAGHPGVQFGPGPGPGLAGGVDGDRPYSSAAGLAGPSGGVLRTGEPGTSGGSGPDPRRAPTGNPFTTGQARATGSPAAGGGGLGTASAPGGAGQEQGTGNTPPRPGAGGERAQSATATWRPPLSSGTDRPAGPAEGSSPVALGPPGAVPPLGGEEVPAAQVPARRTSKKPGPEPGGGGTGGVNKPEDDALARVVPALPAPPPARRPVALPPARLGGNRDWVIFVECRADVVVLYPSRRQFPLEAVAQSPGNNPLVRTVQQMIARRQGLVRPGEPPFRPQVRFLVRPDALRTFHLAYPVLDSLAVPTWRQNLEPEDDVAAITAGS